MCVCCEGGANKASGSLSPLVTLTSITLLHKVTLVFPASGTLSWLIHTNTQLLPVVNIRHVENQVQHFHVSLFPADSVPI